jgi:C4-dicarboxylate-specific signal transduction histidine kinase
MSHQQAKSAPQDAQADLTHMARLTTLGELSASLAHEINQPLAAIALSAASGIHWLNRDHPDLDSAKAALLRIEQDGKRVSAVIRGLLALARKCGPQRSSLDLRDAISETLALTRGEVQQHGVVLHLDLSADKQLVWGDRVQLQQVLLNLIVNGIQAMAEVTDRSRELTISAALAGPGYMQVTVADTGPGLDPVIAPRIFDAFFTTKSDGLGMGLSICQSIIEAHGGKLWASPHAPRSAEFHFTLPIAVEV